MASMTTTIFMIAYCMVNPPANVPADFVCQVVHGTPTFSTLEACEDYPVIKNGSFGPSLEVFCVKKEVAAWERAR